MFLGWLKPAGGDFLPGVPKMFQLHSHADGTHAMDGAPD